MPHLMPIIVSEIAQVLNHRFRGSYKTLEVTIVTINRIVYIVSTATSSRPHALKIIFFSSTLLSPQYLHTIIKDLFARSKLACS